jgi:hypothetical protein
MFDEELKARIDKLQEQLSVEEEEYANAIRSRKDYTTLRTIRDKISGLKKHLQSLS